MTEIEDTGIPDKYEILGKLGHGGMGTVWLGRDRSLDRKVALKVLANKYAEDPKFVKRFETEAQAAASLNHPNIVQIYEFGKTKTGHFIAMELIDGPSLKDELKLIGRFSESQTIELARQVCAALGVAHSAGIVHRDIKPDNMMFTSKRQFKLVDLGLVKRLSDEVSHTVTGQSMGTPHFISPEQILGLGQVDARADIYSLGATIYYLATGTVPFDGSSGAHIMSRHLNDPLPDPRHVAPDLSDDFCCILGRMMAKKPEERYQDMHALDRDFYTLQRGGLVTHFGPVETAMQDTIFMPSADLTHTGKKIEWDVEELRRISVFLSNHVGPLAKVLVKKASEKGLSHEELYTELEGHVRTKEGRQAFAALWEKISEGHSSSLGESSSVSDGYSPTIALQGAAGQSHSAPTGSEPGFASGSVPPGFALDPTTKEALINALMMHVGPVAKVLVQRKLKKSKSVKELVAKLSKNIPSVAAQSAFAEAVARYVN
ncbi:MAG: serine/threonine protein kinase [Candidatus Krumholzibacteriia bacterium]|jgi:serine/threonine protein kinase